MWLEVEALLSNLDPAAYPRGKQGVEYRALRAVRAILGETCDRLLSTIEAETESEVA
jgi:hypothetical protein